ncbi:hypothetical protein C8J56DRAFT_1053093 [Mycena floridula]|nr:hypothetical protein C8J56DRAFT_1053093 [Mycena floridula]
MKQQSQYVLKEIAKEGKHFIQPLPAYNADGTKIIPEKYNNVLKDSIVQIDFTMKHWFIGAESRDVIVADIEKIKVLVETTPAPTISSSPKKRHASDSSSGSPTKKHATA